MEKVPQAGYKIEGLWISGIQRKITLKNLLFPLKLISSLIRARGILKRFKPDAVIGTGGFASGPLLRMAAARGIPNVLQEQNSIAGMTNKWLASRADKICVAYDNMERFFPKNKIVKTGNPVRDHILAVDADQGTSREFFQLDPDRPTLLIIGGSLGARRINELIASKLDFFESEGLQLIWQCGRSYFDTYKTCCSGHVKVFDFINRMDLAYDAADIIISRAGAGSVSELCIVGKPVIFIPSPNVAEDHQTRNAEALVKKNAALMLKESDLEENFDAVFSRMKNSDEERNQLSSEIKNLALPNATIEIVDQIENIIRKKQEDS